MYLHNSAVWEGIERSIPSPSVNNVIHLLVITHKDFAPKLQVQSSEDVENTNYQKMPTKNIKNVWEVCACGDFCTVMIFVIVVLILM